MLLVLRSQQLRNHSTVQTIHVDSLFTAPVLCWSPQDLQKTELDSQLLNTAPISLFVPITMCETADGSLQMSCFNKMLMISIKAIQSKN